VIDITPDSNIDIYISGTNSTITHDPLGFAEQQMRELGVIFDE
jgi:hypothetical protein